MPMLFPIEFDDHRTEATASKEVPPLLTLKRDSPVPQAIALPIVLQTLHTLNEAGEPRGAVLVASDRKQAGVVCPAARKHPY